MASMLSESQLKGQRINQELQVIGKEIDRANHLVGQGNYQQAKSVYLVNAEALNQI